MIPITSKMYAVLRQIDKDADAVAQTGDLQTFYERMVANQEDVRRILKEVLA